MTIRDLISLLEEAESFYPNGLDSQLYFEDEEGNTFPIQDAELYMVHGVPVLTVYEND